MDNLILVDTSYTSFYRYFATLRWMSYVDPKLYNEKKNIKNYDWGNESVFMEKYDKMYLESIRNLVTKKIFNNSNIIFCMDSSQSTLWRRHLMKKYKGARTNLALKHNFREIFKDTYNKLIPSIIKNNTNIHRMKIDTMEADDIIAVISKYFRKKYPDINIYIISGDADFFQLGRKNVFICNYNKKKIHNISEDTAKMLLEYKIIAGDSSDNIPPIYPRLSSKIKKEFLEDDKNLFKFLRNNDAAKAQYALNTKLINFDYIPKNLQRYVVAMINNLKLKLPAKKRHIKI